MRLAFLFSFLCAAAALAGQRPWVGIGVSGIDGLPRTARNPRGLGLRVTHVWPESPAGAAGLRPDDVVVAVDGRALAGPGKGSLASEFTRLLDRKQPGERLQLAVRRANRSFETTVILRARPGTAPSVAVRPNLDLVLAGRVPFPFPWPGDLEVLGELLVDASGKRTAYDDLRRRLRAVEAGDDGFRLDAVRYVHRDPFRMPGATLQLMKSMRSGDPVEGARRAAFRILTGSPGGTPEVGVYPSMPAGKLSVKQFLDLVERSLAAAALAVERSLARIAPADRAWLAANLGSLVDAFDRGIYLFQDPDPARRARVRRIIELARRFDHAALAAGLDALAWSWRPGAVERMVARVAWPPGSSSRAIVARRRTRWGDIVIGGIGNNWHRSEDAAVIIDLGGDDLYTNNAGASVPGKIPVAVVVDLAGDDAYESHRRFTQGTGVLGIGVLVDVKGNDSYVATSFSQGCALLGAGMLVDRAGDDTYRGLSLHQGVGLWGYGALIDMSGDDRYEAHLYAQGVGLSHGVGLLLDERGNDRYYAKGKRPTGYGTPGIFDAWSQGCGLGFRLDASGGVGILSDGGGDDRYEGGNFSQGGGYYFAWGILHDAGKGNDVYIGSRYAQGWSAHQAAGTFIEEGGDDRYLTRHAVNSGLAWDESVTFFLEMGGNDVYQGGGFSQGASAHNSIAIFLDLGGRDRYGGCVPARAGGNDYHGGASWSLFVDAGGDADVYEHGRRERIGNDRIVTGREHFAFCDLPGSVSRALVGNA